MPRQIMSPPPLPTNICVYILCRIKVHVGNPHVSARPGLLRQAGTLAVDLHETYAVYSTRQGVVPRTVRFVPTPDEA